MTETVEAMNQTVETDAEAIPVMKKFDSRSSKNEITVRLIEAILEMPEEDQRNVLQELMSKQLERKKISDRKTETYEESREHPRKASLIPVDCSTHDLCFTNFIQDISEGGVFIETNAPFYVGQKITLNFSLSGTEDVISVGGQVARINSQGIGVKFIEGDVHRLDLSIKD
jgi:type IV pilus assembly protein PilZ